ncbi:MAG TPA: 3-phosphoshikimate 1-carboxyvinyltransferase [Steroidobacteraceae bacterium]|nr:3-phosphoshikimate 1-carboxyvinyltransferase [Steroidobacteraceae bacterium]
MTEPVRPSYRAAPVANLSGSITVPGDKSISHRALMLGGIADGVTQIEGFLESEDCLATMRAMQALGVQIERPASRSVRVHGVGLHGLKAAQTALDMGNSGTAMRLMTGLLSGQGFDSVLVGDESLMRRPMERVAAPLRLMGADIETLEGRPPVQIRGGRRLEGCDYQLPVASAQVKSAVLLAGLYANGVTTVVEPAVTRDHTERMLIGFGCEVAADRGTIRLTAPTRLAACSLEVPGDFSSAAFFIVAATLGADPEVTIRNVGINPTRTGLLDMLGLMGADIRVVNHRTVGAEPVADLVVRRAELRGVEVPRGLVPLAIDEFPVFFVAAACADGETLVTGAEELRVKESDRIAAMAAGLTELGVETQVRPDGLWVRGIGSKGRLGGGRVDSLGDHRIAMSFAIASVRAGAPIEIADVANVATSFPEFVATAQAIGYAIESSAGSAT